MASSSTQKNNNNNSNSNYDSEWEKSLESIDNFDKILIDLRKTGFTILTGLTAASTIFQLGLNIQTGIIHATSILVIILFWLDLYYQNVLAGAILRAHFLEIFRLKRGVSYSITSMYNKAQLHRYTKYAYLGFFIAIVLIGYVITINVGNVNKKDNATYIDKIIGDFTSIPKKIFQSELSRVSILFLIGEIGSLIYLWFQSENKTKLIDTIIKIYYYFLRVELRSENAINELEKMIMKIMSSHIEEETLTDGNYDIYDIIPAPMPHKKRIAKLLLIAKKQFRFWGIGHETTIIFWIFVSKLGILLVEPKSSKRFKIISKSNLGIEDHPNISTILEGLINSAIITKIGFSRHDIQKISDEFYFFLNG